MDGEGGHLMDGCMGWSGTYGWVGMGGLMDEWVGVWVTG